MAPSRVVTHAFRESLGNGNGWPQRYVIDRQTLVDYGYENNVQAFFKKFVVVGLMATCNQLLWSLDKLGYHDTWLVYLTCWLYDEKYASIAARRNISY